MTKSVFLDAMLNCCFLEHELISHALKLSIKREYVILFLTDVRAERLRTRILYPDSLNSSFTIYMTWAKFLCGSDLLSTNSDNNDIYIMEFFEK